MKVKTNEEHYETIDAKLEAFTRFCKAYELDCYGCPMKFIREDLSCFERWKKMEYKTGETNENSI